MNEMEGNLSGPSPTGTLRDNPEVMLCFAPSSVHVKQIQHWLAYEEENFNEGFYCNWPQIAHSFGHGLLVVLLSNEIAIGFLTYRLSSELSAAIELFEISKEYRRKGYGKLLVDGFLCYLKENSIYTADLLSEPTSSKHFWQHMGFTAFPPLKAHNNNSHYLYKILINTQMPTLVPPTGEFIRVWARKFASLSNLADWVWIIKRQHKDTSDIVPIIHPIDDEWLMEWQKEGKILYNGSIRNFRAKAVDYGNFLLLCNLPLLH